MRPQSLLECRGSRRGGSLQPLFWGPKRPQQKDPDSGLSWIYPFGDRVPLPACSWHGVSEALYTPHKQPTQPLGYPTETYTQNSQQFTWAHVAAQRLVAVPEVPEEPMVALITVVKPGPLGASGLIPALRLAMPQPKLPHKTLYDSTHRGITKPWLTSTLTLPSMSGLLNIGGSWSLDLGLCKLEQL